MEHKKPEVPIDTMERRLERLERDSRCWKALTTLAMGALSLIFLIGAGKSGETSVPHEVQAHAFVLVDQNGTPLARLGLLPHGGWGLGFYDQGKKISRESAMIKAYATEIGARVVDRVVQVHGLAGLRHGAPPERAFRDERIARIFEGAAPSDLPIERPTHYDFAINLKTAKELGLTIPQTVLGRVDEVIE